MRQMGVLSLGLWLALSLSGSAQAGQVACLGGNVSLEISTATAGQDPDPALDESTRLRYKKDDAGEPTLKITVATNLASPLFSIEVEAFNAEAGNPTGVVALGTTAQDLVTDITNTSNATCDLRYTASALASGGTGADNHTVTFTTVVQ